MSACKSIVNIPYSSKRLLVLLGIGFVATSLLSACAKEQYIAKPISIAQTTAKLTSKDINSPAFKAYLTQQGYEASNLPFTSWGLNELTLCALFYHSKLDVAKAQLGLAKANLATAGLKQNPTLSGMFSRSNQANGDIQPWLYGLNIDIPIETNQKRSIRIEEAQHLAEVAQLDIAETAWLLRSQIAKDLLRHAENTAQIQLLSQELQVQDKLISLLEKRVQVGALSNTELYPAQLLQQKVRFALQTEQAKTQEIRASLATDVGLTSEQFNQIQLKPLDVEVSLASQTEKIATLTPKKLQENALLNRLDIRCSLEKYAAAEAKIKLEVAKQTPDIALNPGYAFEFGDSVWSLGFASLLNLLHQNQTLIQEATQLREVEGAQFEALQASIMGDVEQSLASYQASAQNVHQMKQQQDAQALLRQKLQRQLEAGLSDRLELTQNELSSILLKQQLSSAQFNHLHAALKLEELMQRPIFDDFSLQTLPSDEALQKNHSHTEFSSTNTAGTSP
jgi:outer membrane protein, heavy metal efflux system